MNYAFITLWLDAAWLWSSRATYLRRGRLATGSYAFAFYALAVAVSMLAVAAAGVRMPINPSSLILHRES